MENNVSRRKLLAAGAGMLAVASAGCAGATEEEYAQTAVNDLQSIRPPPRVESTEDIVEAIQWQNEAMYIMVSGLEALAKGDATTS